MSWRLLKLLHVHLSATVHARIGEPKHDPMQIFPPETKPAGSPPVFLSLLNARHDENHDFLNCTHIPLVMVWPKSTSLRRPIYWDSKYSSTSKSIPVVDMNSSRERGI